MINNNKGAILLVTVVSMMVLTIIGYITLQMTSSQGVTDTYEQARIRTEYAAEGIVERAKGYIEYIVEQNKLSKENSIGDVFGDRGYYPPASGFLFSKVREESENNVEHRWNIFEGVVDSTFHYGDNTGSVSDVFDDSVYPVIRASVWCEFVTDKIKGANKGNDLGICTFDASDDSKQKQTYRIVGVASTIVNAEDVGVVTSTVIYYFNTKRNHNSEDSKIKYDNERTTLIWRKEKVS